MTWTRSADEVLATLQDLVANGSVNPALPGGTQGESSEIGGRKKQVLSDHASSVSLVSFTSTEWISQSTP